MPHPSSSYRKSGRDVEGPNRHDGVLGTVHRRGEKERNHLCMAHGRPR